MKEVNMVNLEKVKDRITKLQDNLFKISYEIDVSLEDELGILIEQDIAYQEEIMIEDLQEKIENNLIKGYIVISFNDVEDYEIVFGIASQFEMLSSGMSLME